FFLFQAEDGIRDRNVTGVQTCALPILADIDVLITPTLPVPPPSLTQEVIQWNGVNEHILSALSRFTGPFNMNGLPALSIPIGTNQNNLPIGLQLVGKMYDEHKLLSI